jgi:hypothetical protein
MQDRMGHGYGLQRILVKSLRFIADSTSLLFKQNKITHVSIGSSVVFFLNLMRIYKFACLLMSISSPGVILCMHVVFH